MQLAPAQDDCTTPVAYEAEVSPSKFMDNSPKLSDMSWQLEARAASIKQVIMLPVAVTKAAQAMLVLPAQTVASVPEEWPRAVQKMLVQLSYAGHGPPGAWNKVPLLHGAAAAKPTKTAATKIKRMVDIFSI